MTIARALALVACCAGGCGGSTLPGDAAMSGSASEDGGSAKDAAQTPIVSADASIVDAATASDLAAPPKGTGVKWHPGHYAGSYNTIHQGDTAFSTSEIDMALKNANVEGYYAIFYWGALETDKGVYDFTLLDAQRQYIAKNYPGKRYGIMVWAENFGSGPDKSFGGVIPKYVQSDATTYGPGPNGTSGWWTMEYGGCAAWWRPAVAARIEALFAAIAAHASPYGNGTTYDTDPYVEIVTWNESATTLTSGSDYDHATAVAQWAAIDASLLKSFAHTNVIFQNNYFGAGGSSIADTSQIELTAAKQGCALGGPDTFSSLTWGQAGYVGTAAAGTSPMFGMAPFIAFVQEPDYKADTKGITDIMSIGIDTLKASQLWWTVVAEGSTYVGDWSTKIVPLINANPIPAANKVCPTSYAARGGCDTN